MALNSSNQSLSHLFTEFTAVSAFWYIFLINDTHSTKNEANIVITHDYCILTFWAIFNLLCHSYTLLDKHSSLYALFSISDGSVVVFLILHKTQSMLSVTFLNLWNDKKPNFTKTTEILVCINQTSWWMPPSGMLCHVTRASVDILEEHIASIIMVTRIDN
jgi:hypothetical protein